MIGRTISHYKILEKLGQGGMGVVYKAEDLRLKRVVALKFLSVQALGDEEEKTRFIHEAQAAAALDHPNICTVHEIDETDGETFISMAYVEGQNLKERIKTGPFGLDEFADFAKQIAQGLQEAHERGVVHRDIKPANMMISAKSRVAIMDFGLAKLGERTRLTKTGTTVGTVSYMSPEQAAGKHADHRTDIWSFGVLLYEMITGQQPFKGDYEPAVVYSILNDQPEPVTGLRTGIPIELERIIGKCLEKDPAERYQTVADILADLRRFDRAWTGGVSDSRSTKRPGARGPVRWWLGVGAVVIAVILGVTVIPRFFRPSGEHQVPDRKMLVVLPFENLGRAEDEYFAAGITEEITCRLASVMKLGVISRTTAVQYTHTEKTVKQIGNELGVEYVLEGTVRWAGGPGGDNRVRITPQLIRVSDDTHLWSEPFDHVVDDIFEVQSAIAGKVVEALGVTLLHTEREAVEFRPTENMQAYHAYLRGRYYASHLHFSLENWERVLQQYQRAVELDPEFGLAYAELAKAHGRLVYLRHDLSPERRNQAKAAIDKAVELAGDSPEVRLALGYYYLWVERDGDKALAEYAFVAKHWPENAELLRAKADVFRHQGLWQKALEHNQRACEFNPEDAPTVYDLALTNWCMRRYPEALAACDRAIALAPGEVWSYLTKAYNYWSWNGDLELARAALEAVPPDHSWAPWSWYWQNMFEGRYKEAIDYIAAVPGDWVRLKICARPYILLTAHAHKLMGEKELALAEYDSARVLLESAVGLYPDDPRYHSSLGITCAALGLKEKAIREGKRAVELLPISEDATYGQPYAYDLAIIYAMAGDYDAAVKELDFILSAPSWFSVSWVELDPLWNPLREYPPFQRVLDKYSGVESSATD